MSGRGPRSGGRQAAGDGELDSADGVLVWNGMVARIRPATVPRCASDGPRRGDRSDRADPSARTGAGPRTPSASAERRIAISLPSRTREPERVVAHLGPTNSGKTHAALDELVAKGAGVYAGPLRMLAQEAHRRLGGAHRIRERRARHR